MTARLLLSVLLLVAAILDLGGAPSNRPLAFAGLAVGIALAATLIVDRINLLRRRAATPP